jgi:hypothetical protein
MRWQVQSVEESALHLEQSRALVCLFAAGVGVSSCGGGGSSRGGGSGTPTGSYTVSVTGTFTAGAAQLTHTVKLL